VCMEGKMEKKINDFVVFCLECYKAKNGLNGKDAYVLFEKYGILDYLREGYEMLHTQGKDWLMNDIEELLRIKMEDE